MRNVRQPKMHSTREKQPLPVFFIASIFASPICCAITYYAAWHVFTGYDACGVGIIGLVVTLLIGFVFLLLSERYERVGEWVFYSSALLNSVYWGFLLLYLLPRLNG
jgi:multisubunit Na+/H+ antiporter MnhB subunit